MTPTPPNLRLDHIGTEERPYLYRLVEPVTITLFDGSELTIPAGYETNFASVPRKLQGMFPTQGPAISIASLVHDYLYDTRTFPINWAEKRRADREFLYLLEKFSPEKETRNKMMFVAVKLFGRKQFREE